MYGIDEKRSYIERFRSEKGQNNIDVCEACVPGLYLEAVGSGDESDCLECPSGFYGTEEGKAFCLPCLPGTRQPNSGEIECIPCLSGRFSDSVESNATECQKCEKGQYMDEKGSTICLTCATGKYMNEKASTKCKNCDEHTYIDAREAHVCDVCPTGWSAKDFGQASCQICSVGKFGKSNSFVQSSFNVFSIITASKLTQNTVTNLSKLYQLTFAQCVRLF